MRAEEADIALTWRHTSSEHVCPVQTAMQWIRRHENLVRRL